MPRKLAHISTSVSASDRISLWGAGFVGNDVVTNTAIDRPFLEHFPLIRLSRPITPPASAAIVNGFGGAIRFELQGLLTTDASPDQLTINARFGCKVNDILTGALVGTVAFTPPASLAAVPITIRGVCVTRSNGPISNYTKAKLEADVMFAKADATMLMYGMRSTGTGTAGFSADVDLNSFGYAFQLSAKWAAAKATNILQISQSVYENIGPEI